MCDIAAVIEQTRKWILEVVIGCNFCPFAFRVMKKNSLHFQVELSDELSLCLEAFLQECRRLDKDLEIDSTLVIYPNSFQRFDDFLDTVSLAEKLLKRNGYEGIYQVASFHPLYRFANSTLHDAANYTNRSLYPMLHLLRENLMEEALLNYPNPEQIPNKNISFAREKGEAYMKMLRESCL
jgi:hypothetical protein